MGRTSAKPSVCVFFYLLHTSKMRAFLGSEDTWLSSQLACIRVKTWFSELGLS